MANVNINSDVDDMFYRYKMPRLVAKVEGKGNGIKTVIANMVDIAKALNRPPMYPTKFFGCELGAQTQFDAKNDRYIVNGEHDREKLVSLLDGFIKKFILCQSCSNPETTYRVKKNIIEVSCKACGAQSNLDPRHKLTSYIIKYPPQDESEGAPAKKERKNRAKDGSSPTAETPTTPDGDILAGSENFEDKHVDEDDWAVNPEDAAERQKEIGDQMAALTVNQEMEKTLEERMSLLEAFLKDQKSKESKGKQVDLRAIKQESERYDLAEKAPYLIATEMLDRNITKKLATYKPLLVKMCSSNSRAQKYLLGGLEVLFVTDLAHFGPLIPQVLKWFYDEDILTEQVMLEWGVKSSKKYVSKEHNKQIRQKAEPLLKWLQEAEEESDEEDDDGVEVDFGETNGVVIKNGTPAVSAGDVGGAEDKQNGKSNGKGEANGEEDFDIDDI